MSQSAHPEGRRALGLEWAPLNIPLERRLQTFAVFFHLYVMILFCGIFIPCSTIYIFFYSPTYRCYHPHGLIGLGAFVHFCTEATEAEKVFPGIKFRLTTLRTNFCFPIIREYLMSFGFASVSKVSISNILSKKEKGFGVMIAVGGAQEGLDAHPGKHDLYLTQRKGFVKQAIQHGADLVPVFSFGENDLWWTVENPPGSRLRKFQDIFKRITGVSPMVFHGRGIFNYTIGLMPYRKPIHTVVGKPISVTQNPNPTREEISEVHARYIEELNALFNEHKSRFADKDAVLNIS